MWCLCAVFVVVRNSWGGQGKGACEHHKKCCRTGNSGIPGPFLYGERTKGTRIGAEILSGKALFKEEGKKKAMVLMEGKREAEIVESGGVGVFGRNSYLQFFISVILMGLHTWLPAYVLGMADVMSVVSLHESGHTI